MFSKVYADAPEVWQLGLQDPASPAVEGMIFFHDYLFLFLIIIGVFVFLMMYKTVIDFDGEHSNDSKYIKIAQRFTHSSLLEIVWTIIPAVLLILIAVPSFALLYSLDELLDPQITLKIVGHQWYWSYEYSDYNHLTEENAGINFDSYMVADEDLEKGQFRLLEVDNRIVLPINTHIRVLITAADVLHSWAVPSFGVKVDACPGRLNQTTVFIKKPGVFYGQCSELCGTNHGFMPICVEAVELEDYTIWLEKKLEL